MKLNKDYTQKYIVSNIECLLNASKDLLVSKSFKKVHKYLSQAWLMSSSLRSSNEKKTPLIINCLTSFGHYYKAVNNLQESVRYYEEALALSQSECISLSTISLHLHLASSLSCQGQHESALRHNLKALGLLKRISTCSQEYLESTVIAFFNIAVEYEYLKEYKDSEDCYLKGYKFAQRHLGESHKLTIQIKQSITDLLIIKPVKRLNLSTLRVSTAASETSRRRSSSMTRRSSSYSVKIKSIDVEIHKKIEQRAAIIIQKVWRGYWVRKNFIELTLNSRLEKAALDARVAIEKYENEKRKIGLIKQKVGGQGVRQVQALVSFKKLKEVFGLNSK